MPGVVTVVDFSPRLKHCHVFQVLFQLARSWDGCVKMCNTGLLMEDSVHRRRDDENYTKKGCTAALAFVFS